MQNYTQKNNIKNLNAQTIDALDFGFEPDKYNFIIAAFSLIFFKLSDLIVLIEKIKKSSMENGVIYFSVFSTEEPAYNSLIDELKLKEIEKNTFFLPKQKVYRHFFTVEELKDFFNDWEIIFLDQKNKKDCHGEKGEHFHNIIEILAKKEGD